MHQLLTGGQNSTHQPQQQVVNLQSKRLTDTHTYKHVIVFGQVNYVSCYTNTYARTNLYSFLVKSVMSLQYTRHSEQQGSHHLVTATYTHRQQQNAAPLRSTSAAMLYLTRSSATLWMPVLRTASVRASAGARNRVHTRFWVYVIPSGVAKNSTSKLKNALWLVERLCTFPFVYNTGIFARRCIPCMSDRQQGGSLCRTRKQIS
jgi:hypothetical protein